MIYQVIDPILYVSIHTNCEKDVYLSFFLSTIECFLLNGSQFHIFTIVISEENWYLGMNNIRWFFDIQLNLLCQNKYRGFWRDFRAFRLSFRFAPVMVLPKKKLDFMGDFKSFENSIIFPHKILINLRIQKRFKTSLKNVVRKAFGKLSYPFSCRKSFVYFLVKIIFG